MAEKTWVEVDFLDRWYADREAGVERTLGDYLALYPGHEDEIGKVFRVVTDATLAALSNPPDGTSDFQARDLGPYRLVRELGRGGQAVVYLAEDLQLRRPVALKVLTGRGPLSSELLARFQREAEITSRLAHPNICAVYGAGTIDGSSYIAMRYEEGETLAARIAAQSRAAGPETAPEGSGSTTEGEGRIPGAGKALRSKVEIRALLAFFETIARALHAAHEKGVIHRDIKPGNLLIAKDGRPVILDFGLARTLDGDEVTLTKTGDFFGTPAYMAPEQIRACATGIDRRVDVWALGVTLYESLAGRRPFAAATRDLLVQTILQREPEDPRKQCPFISRDLAVVIATAIEKDLGRRYSTAEAFADDLAAAREDRPIAARKVTLAGRVLRWTRREPFRAGFAATLLVAIPLLLVLGLNWYATRGLAERGRVEARREAYESAVERAYFALIDGDDAAAERLFREAGDCQRGETEVLAGLMLVFLARHDRGAVLELYSANEAVFDRLASFKGLRESARTGTPEAFAAFQSLTELPPPVDATDCMLSGSRMLIHGARGSMEHAERGVTLLVEAIMRSPRARRLHHILLAHAACCANDGQTASAEARVLHERWPQDSTAVFWRGRCLLVARDSKAAAAAFDQALLLRPDWPLAMAFRGRTAFADGDLEVAESLFRRVALLEPKNFTNQDDLAHVLRKQGRLEEARTILEAALAAQPWVALGWVNLGQVREDLRDFDGALEAMNRMIAIDPAYPPAYLELGRIRAVRGESEEAVAAFREAVRRRPEFVEARLRLGIALVGLNLIDEAALELKAVLGLDVGNAAARAYLGRTLMSKDRFREALELIEGALRDGEERQPWVPKARAWRDDCARSALRESRAAERLAGGKPSVTCEDLIAEANVLGQERRFAEAVATWLRVDGMGLRDESDIAGSSHWRAIDAALLAAEVMSGNGAESAEARAGFRNRALSWLSIDLALFRKHVERGSSRLLLRRLAAGWRVGAELASVRGDAALARLPDDERAAWLAFWREFEAFAEDLEAQ